MPKLDKQHIDKLKRVASRNKGRKGLENFDDKYFLARDLWLEIEKLKLDRDLLWQARRNFVVNLVTVLEVFLKDLIVVQRDRWKHEGFSKVLDEKVSLDEAYTIFKHNKLTRELLITHYYSFQNVDSIKRVFDPLTGKDFLNEIGTYVYRDKDGAISLSKNEVIKNLKMLFDLRHRIVHEGLHDRISRKQTEEFDDAVFGIVLIIFDYCTSNHVSTVTSK
jgi:hypothetical protein